MGVVGVHHDDHGFLGNFSSVFFEANPSPIQEKIEIKPSDLLRKPSNPKKSWRKTL